MIIFSLVLISKLNIFLNLFFFFFLKTNKPSHTSTKSDLTSLPHSCNFNESLFIASAQKYIKLSNGCNSRQWWWWTAVNTKNFLLMLKSFFNFIHIFIYFAILIFQEIFFLLTFLSQISSQNEFHPIAKILFYPF